VRTVSLRCIRGERWKFDGKVCPNHGLGQGRSIKASYRKLISYFSVLDVPRRRYLAEMVMALIVEVAMGLLVEPDVGDEAVWVQEPLPEPMLPDNSERQPSSCRVDEDLSSVQLDQQACVWLLDRIQMSRSAFQIGPLCLIGM
jgi:hypothetical protein